jgi:uncharacterized protein
MSPAEARPMPFWSYRDVFLFLGIALPSLLLSVALVHVLHPLLHLAAGFEELLAQSIWYVLVFGFLFALFRIVYQRPFWESLGWTPPFPYAGLCFLLGPFLAIGIGYLGHMLQAPEIPTPFAKMLENRPTLILFSIFAVVLGPVCEELAFRGFLMPLLMRSFGPVSGILGSAILFGALHAPEYQKTWQYAVLIGLAGAIFGWVRYRTGSTASATFLHSSYNLTQLAAMWVQNGTSS